MCIILLEFTLMLIKPTTNHFLFLINFIIFLCSATKIKIHKAALEDMINAYSCTCC